MLAGRTVRSVTRSGKRVLLEFSDRSGTGSPVWLAVHLRMTGRLEFVDGPPARADPHLRARFRLDRGELRFLDVRRFGTFDWFRDRAGTEPSGIDPLAPDLDVAALRHSIRGSSQPLKTWLLRQDRLVGIGNIYASEIAWSARISPFRPVGALDDRELRRLLSSTRRILERAIEAGGTTLSDYRNARGEVGSFQVRLSVYGRAGERCRRCRTPIEREVQGQRSTFWCPGCQGRRSGDDS